MSYGLERTIAQSPKTPIMMFKTITTIRVELLLNFHSIQSIQNFLNTIFVLHYFYKKKVHTSISIIHINEYYIIVIELFFFDSSYQAK